MNPRRVFEPGPPSPPRGRAPQERERIGASLHALLRYQQRIERTIAPDVAAARFDLALRRPVDLPYRHVASNWADLGRARMRLGRKDGVRYVLAGRAVGIVRDRTVVTVIRRCSDEDLVVLLVHALTGVWVAT